MQRIHGLIFAIALCGACLRADASAILYAFQGTDGTRIEFQQPTLVGPTANFNVGPQDILDCSVPQGVCGNLTVLAASPIPGSTADQLVPGQQPPAVFADGTFSQVGAAYTLSDSAKQGRLAVYEYDPDDVYEYFFKDSTGTRTMLFYTERLLLETFELPDAVLAGCAFGVGVACAGLDLEMDVFPEDVLQFGNAGLDTVYFFPRFAFSTVGIHYTLDGITSGVLRVERLARRNMQDPALLLPDTPRIPRDPGTGNPIGGPLDPRVDAEPVPEPGTWLLGGLGLALLAAFRRRFV